MVYPSRHHLYEVYIHQILTKGGDDDVFRASFERGFWFTHPPPLPSVYTRLFLWSAHFFHYHGMSWWCRLVFDKSFVSPAAFDGVEEFSHLWVKLSFRSLRCSTSIRYYRSTSICVLSGSYISLTLAKYFYEWHTIKLLYSLSLHVLFNNKCPLSPGFDFTRTLDWFYFPCETDSYCGTLFASGLGGKGGLCNSKELHKSR